MALPVDGGGDGLDSLTSSGRAYFIFSIAEVALTGCMLLLMLSVSTYVVRCRRRGRRLCVPRASLGMLGIIWVLCTFFSHVALWDILDSLGVISVATLADEMEIVCMATTSISLGLVEPALLLLIAEVIRLKTAVSTSRMRSVFPRWTLNRRAYALALPFALLQALLMVVGTIDGMTSQGFLPQPGLSPGLSPSVGAQAPPPPPLPPLSPLTRPVETRSGVDYEYRWWHDEGCAHSIASLIVSALFILPFEFFWTLWCLRLAKLVLNLKMRRRLLVVQLTYTFIPGCILLLRASEVFIRAEMDGVLRLLHLLELLLVVLGCWVCNLHLLWRPLKEGGAAVWTVSDSDPAPEPRVAPNYVMLAAVNRLDHTKLEPRRQADSKPAATPLGPSGARSLPMVVAESELMTGQVHEVDPSRLSLDGEPVHLTIDRGDETDPPPPGLSERCVCDSGSGDHALSLEAVGMELSGGTVTPTGSVDERASGFDSSGSEADGISPGVQGDRLLFGGKPLRSVAVEMHGRDASAGGGGARPRGSTPGHQTDALV